MNWLNLFPGDSEKSQKNHKRKTAPKSRRLGFETLESREMLSVSPLLSATEKETVLPDVFRPESAAYLATDQDITYSAIMPLAASSSSRTTRTFGTYEGYNLDQYLKRKDGPIRFAIDIDLLPGEKIVPNSKATLTLRVYDVDVGPAPDFEFDRVSINGHVVPKEFLTGANNSWSIVTFDDIDSSWLKPGENWIEIDIDIYNKGWAVTCDWGELRVEVEGAGIEDVKVSHAGGKAVPVTMEMVKLEAVLDPELKARVDKGELKVTEVVWQINGTNISYPAKTVKGGSLEYEFKPDAGTHGICSVTTTISLVENATGKAYGSVKHEGNFLLFFRHNENDRMPGQGEEPNWYYYWKRDGAVPELNYINVSYDSTLKLVLRGEYNPSLKTIKIGPAAQNYQPLSTPTIGPGITVVGASVTFSEKKAGIDAVRATVVHERKHMDVDISKSIFDIDLDVKYSRKERQDLADANNYQVGTHEEKQFLENYFNLIDIRRTGDGLNLSSETALGTWTILTDTWDMAGLFNYPKYLNSGDQEYLAFLAGSAAEPGIKENDWSSEGSQSAGKQLQSTKKNTTPAQALAAAADETVLMTPEIPINNFATLREDMGIALFTVGTTYTDVVKDTNGNSKFDELVISVTLDVPHDGNYAFAADLYGADDFLITNLYIRFDLDAGTRTIDLHFDGRMLGTLGINGPYELDLRVYDDKMNIIEGGVAVHTTQAYKASDFEQILDIKVTDEKTIDTNANTLYDILQITTEVTAPAEGSYSFYAALYASDDTLITYTLVDALLVVGKNQVVIDFDGTDIAREQLNGPYRVVINSFAGYDSTLFFDDNIHETQAYAWTQFEGAQAALNGTFSDYGTDVDGNGKFDFLTVDVGVNVAVAGTYEISAYLIDSTGAYTDYVLTTATLQPGQQTVSLNFESIFIWAHGTSGTFTIASILLSDVNGTNLTYLTNAYTTGSYDLNDFQQEAVVFTQNNRETVVDVDQDGKIDAIEVAFGVNVNTAGTYYFSAVLSDAQGNTIQYVNKTSELAAGNREIIISINWRTIYDLQADGPYRISGISLFNSQGQLVATTSSYTTQAYQHTDFESPSVVLGDIEDYLVPGKDAKQPNNLCVSLEVFVETAGTYNLNARLMDIEGNEIGWASINSSLKAGEYNTVELVFNGQEIYDNGVPGPYYVRNLSIYAISGSSFDSLFLWDVHETAVYSLSDFGAKNVTVTTLSDTVNPNDGLISLREAIEYANSGDTITFAPSLYGKTITLGGSELIIDKNITINATGANITIDANQQSRVFNIADGTTVALIGLTMTNGFSDGNGGGLCNAGILTVANCEISGNSAIHWDPYSSSFGGGIYNSGTLMMTNSIISENLTDGLGGGIFNDGYRGNGMMTLTNCTISGNATKIGAHLSGGGIYNYGTMAVANSVISGNMAAGSGGGIYNEGTLTVTNSTIVGNLARGGSVGGIYQHHLSLLTLNNTIAAKNTSPFGEGLGVGGSSETISGNNNFIDEKSSHIHSIANGVNGNIVGTAANPIDPKFVHFTHYEPDLWTRDLWKSWNLRLAVNSPAINKGNNAYAVGTTDLAGKPRIANGTVDIGAYEYDGVIVPVTSLTPNKNVKVPTKPKATSGAQSVTVSWTAPTSTNVLGYKIVYTSKKAPGGEMVVSGNSASISGLLPGVAYSFKIYTITADNLISTNSAAVSATTKTAPAPLSVKANANGMSEIIITWQPPKASTIPADLTLTGYAILNASGGVIESVGSGVTSYKVTGLNPKTAYSYKIVALFGTLQSAKPVTVKATTTAFVAPKLTKAIAGDIGLTSVTLCWQVHPDATSFDVKVLQNKKSVPVTFGAGGNAVWVEDTSEKIVGVTITGLDPGKKYDFEIRGLSSVVSTPSAVAKRAVTTLKFPATATPAVVKNSLSTQSVDLTWKAPVLPQGVPGKIYYEIYYTETKGLKPGAAGWTQIPALGNGVKVSLSGTTAAVTGLGAGKTYYFYVRSIWSEEESVFSNSSALTVKMKAL